MNNDRIIEGVKLAVEALRLYKPEEKIVILNTAGKLVDEKMNMEIRIQTTAAMLQKMMGGD